MARRPFQALLPLLLLAACSPAAGEDVQAAPPRPAPTLLAAPAPVPAPPPVFGAPEAGFPVRAVLAPDRMLGARDYVWDDTDVPPGELRIVIDLEARMLHAYRGGIEIGRAWIVYGGGGKETPTGLFPILEKDADHVSNLYDAEMPWMLRLTWDGIAIHGSPVDETVVTHGCVGIPDEFAELLFREAKKGDLVLVTNGWMAGRRVTAAEAPPENPA